MMSKRKHDEVEITDLPKKRCKSKIENKTRCKFCPRVFVENKNYLRHLKNSHGTTFNCKHCSYTTRYKLNIPKHMVTHGSILKWFRCRYCDRQFKRNNARRYHEVSHTGVSCKICNEKFYSPCTILSHIGTQHPEENKYHCDICGKSYPTNIMRNSHFRNSNCRNGYNDKKELFPNNRSNRKSYKFYCDLCSKGFNEENSLLSHKFMRLCRNSKITDLQFSWAKHFVTDCKLCGQTIESRVQLKKHLLSKHNDAFYLGKPTLSEECPFCGKFIKDKIGRFMHVIRHLGFVPLKCHICNFRTSWTVSLKMHLVKIHDSKCYMCHLCNKSYTNSSDYKEHLNDEHNIIQEFKYLCDDCGMGFYYQKTFHNHQKKCRSNVSRVKTISKLKCENCQMDFKNEENCSLHAANNECDACGFNFESCLGVKQHKLLFSFDRLCSFCSYIAGHGSHLSRHIKEMHPSYCLECDICKKQFSNSITYVRHLKSHYYRKNCENFPKKSFYYKPTYDSEDEDLFSIDKFRPEIPKHNEFVLLFECSICGMYFSSANQSLDHERIHKVSFNLIDESEKINEKCLLNEYYTNFVIQKVAEVKIKAKSCSVPLRRNEYLMKMPNLNKPGSILVSSDQSQLCKVRRRYICEESSDIDIKLKKQSNGHVYHKKLTVKSKQNLTQIDIKLMKITKKIKKTLTPILINNLAFKHGPIIPNDSSSRFIKLKNPKTPRVASISASCDSQYRALLENEQDFAEIQHTQCKSKRDIHIEQFMPMAVGHENDCRYTQIQNGDEKNCNSVVGKHTDTFINKNIVSTFKEGRFNYDIKNNQVNFKDMKPINLSSVDSILTKKLKYVGVINLPENFSRHCYQTLSASTETSLVI